MKEQTPLKQAELLNYIDNQFVKVKKDVTPLVMCPTEYNKSWANLEKGYLRTLGEKLNPSIQIMWTKDRVVKIFIVMVWTGLTLRLKDRHIYGGISR